MTATWQPGGGKPISRSKAARPSGKTDGLQPEGSHPEYGALRRADPGGSSQLTRPENRGDGHRKGKTLVATLPAYLNGLAQQGVHVLRSNDYLARRDSEVGKEPIMEFLFLTIDCIDKYRAHSDDRKLGLHFDTTYGTNEFSF
ncbi:MAG: hypothetical protein IPG32_13605 [Saprospirales bacterium]|nr:hypothetical protein [Saprospirales bacterium]